MCCSKSIDLEAIRARVNEHVMDNGGVMIRYLADNTDGRSVWLKNRYVKFSAVYPERAVTPIQATHALTLPRGKGKLANLPLFELVEADESAETEPEPTPEPAPAAPEVQRVETVTAPSIKEDELVSVESAPAELVEADDSAEAEPKPETENFTVTANALEDASAAAVKEANAAGLRLATLGITDRKITVKDVRDALEAKANA